MIIGVENISGIFSIFHDGSIIHYASNGSDLELDVEILYLAERVNTNYQTFHLTLRNVRDLVFKAWSKDFSAEPDLRLSLTQIFDPELGILSSSSAGDVIEVVCDIYSQTCDCNGGSLLFKADSAVVTDEGDKEYSIEELCQLCDGYWSDWEKKNANRQQ